MNYEGEERRKLNFDSLCLLKEHFKEVCEMKMRGQEKALDLARENLDARLENMNEFRQSLKDQQMNFVIRPEHDFVLKDIRELRDEAATLRGKASQLSVNIAYIMTIASLLTSVVLHFSK